MRWFCYRRCWKFRSVSVLSSEAFWTNASKETWFDKINQMLVSQVKCMRKEPAKCFQRRFRYHLLVDFWNRSVPLFFSRFRILPNNSLCFIRLLYFVFPLVLHSFPRWFFFSRFYLRTRGIYARIFKLDFDTKFSFRFIYVALCF